MADPHHPIRSLMEHREKAAGKDGPSTEVHHWDPADPLLELPAIYYSDLPDEPGTVVQYSSLIVKSPDANMIEHRDGFPLTPPDASTWTPVAIEGAFVHRYGRRAGIGDASCLRVGDPADFRDLVACWNRRSACVPILFHDPSGADRFRSHREWALRPIGRGTWS